MSSQLRLHLLGPPRVILDGQLVTGFKSAKTQALLFYVAFARRPRSRPELAAMFWPDASENRANTSLRTSLSNLRRLLGDHLDITRRTVAINPSRNTNLDVTQFDALLRPGIGEAPDILQVETAVSLYAGDFLEGFHLADAPLFEQWATIEETRLREALLNSLQTLALWHAEHAEYQVSLDYLARLLALDPIRDVGHRLKMAVLAMSGQSGAALTHFDVSRRIRSEQLGLDPTPEIAALYELILHDRFPKAGRTARGELIADMGLGSVDAGTTTSPETPAVLSKLTARRSVKVYWGDMPAKTDLCGRRQQVAQLAHWLTTERCRLVAIVGIGGVGKTTLAAEMTRLMAGSGLERPQETTSVGESKQPTDPPFDQIIWRSLVNAPPVADIVNDWLQILPDEKLSELPDTLEARLSLLLKEMQRKRCLLILDNAESVLQQEDEVDPSRLTQGAYLQLFRQISNTDHQSCLLLTSREAPPRVRQMASEHSKIGLLQLEGLPATAGADLLRLRGLDSTPEKLESIVARYSGNPLALKLVAETVRELFAGDVGEFLHDETLIFADLREVLDQQYGRLSELEQEILTWLAIEREPVTAQVLWDDLVHVPHRRQFLEALRLLQRRSLIEQYLDPDGDAPARFALQNVVMEYLTSRLVETVCQELESSKMRMSQRYALVKAHTKEYVEDSQRRLLLQPVARWFCTRLGQAGAVDRLRDLLKTLHDQAPRTPGYAGANILHLLLEIGVDLSDYDFSNLAMWQADLRDTLLLDISFRGADLRGSLFRDSFGIVMAVSISPNGQSLAAGSTDGSVTLWGLNEYQPQHILKQHTGFVSAVVFSQDGRSLASASSDHTIGLWDVLSGKLIRQLSGHTASVYTVAFSPDGQTLFSSSEDQTIGIWDTQSGRLQEQIREQGDRFVAIAVSPDGQNLAGGGQDGSVYLWDIRSRELKYKIHAHHGKVQSVAFSPDGVMLVTAGEDNKIHLWGVLDGAKHGSLDGHSNWVLSVAYSPDGTRLASGSADRTVRLWDVQSSQTIRVLRGYKNWVTSVAISPDGELVAGGSYDRRIRLWDMRSGRLVHTLRGSLRWVDRLVYSPDGSLLASASFDKPVLLWDGQTGGLLRRFEGHSSSVRCIAFSPDGRIIAGGSDDQKIYLWDIESGVLLQTLTGHKGFVRTLAFSPDGQFLATGDLEGELRLWQMKNGQTYLSWPDVSLGLKDSICFSPDGRLLAFGRMDHSIQLVEPATGHTHATLVGHPAPAELVRFSSDGSLLASKAKDGTIGVWRLRANGDGSNRPLFWWPTSMEGLWNLVFSPDGRLLAAQLEEGAVGLWELTNGRLSYSIEEYVMGEGCLAFSRNSAFLITGNIAGEVRLWNATSGRLVQALEGHDGSVTSLAISSNDDHIASSSGDGTIRVWDTLTGSCLRIMTPPGPYAGMDITGATGLTPAQSAALQTLGAVID